MIQEVLLVFLQAFLHSQEACGILINSASVTFWGEEQCAYYRFWSIKQGNKCHDQGRWDIGSKFRSRTFFCSSFLLLGRLEESAILLKEYLEKTIDLRRLNLIKFNSGLTTYFCLCIYWFFLLLSSKVVYFHPLLL